MKVAVLGTGMVDPSLTGGETTMFVAGDDAGAKAQVTGILSEWFGWTDIMDIGGIAMARGLESWLPLWVRLYGNVGHERFNLKLVIGE